MPLFLVFALFVVAAVSAAFFTGVASGPSLDRFRRQHPLMAWLGFAASVGYVVGAGTVIEGLPEFAVSGLGTSVATGLLLCALTGLAAGVALRLGFGYLVQLALRKTGRMRYGSVVLF